MPNFRLVVTPSAVIRLLLILATLSAISGCAPKKATPSGYYQGTWKSDTQSGLLVIHITLDGKLSGKMEIDDKTGSGPYLNGQIQADGSFAFEASGKKVEGTYNTDSPGLLMGEGTITPSLHAFTFSVRPDDEKNNPPSPQQTSPAPQQAIPQTTESVIVESPAPQINPPVSTEQRTILYAALITRPTDAKQAYIYWSQKRDGSFQDFQNKVFLTVTPQFHLDHHVQCDVKFINSDQLPPTAVELTEFESVGSFANP